MHSLLFQMVCRTLGLRFHVRAYGHSPAAELPADRRFALAEVLQLMDTLYDKLTAGHRCP